MKKMKTVIGIALMVKAFAFLALFIIYWSRKRSLAKAFAAFAAVSGVAGAYCLISELRCCRSIGEFDEDDIDEDFADLDVCEDDILCSFDEEEAAAEENSAE